MRLRPALFAFFCFVCAVQTVNADGPADNRPESVRVIPPPGIAIPNETKDSLLARCSEIRARWAELLDKHKPARNPKTKKFESGQVTRFKKMEGFTPEVLVFPRAIELSIEFQQFYREAEFKHAEELLDEAERRIAAVAGGGDWAEVVGLTDPSKRQLIVGGYQSKIDRSFQPYSVVIPPAFVATSNRPRRLDLWFHGRGEKLSELGFLKKQQVSAGQFTPDDSFVLHPYGRYSNAFKFAGEIDVLESLEYIQTRLPVDRNRISVRGFSMGGAGCWQMAVHYPDRFFAVNPGAGFSETPEFLAFFQGEDAKANDPAYQQTLWQMYDCPPWAINLSNLPTIAYSGEIDRQKQAADVMEKALAEHGIQLMHVIGPKTAHKIHADSKIDIQQRLQQIASRVTNATPKRVQFATTTLRYHKNEWVDVQGLAEHWKPAKVDASILDQNALSVTTKNVSALRLSFDAGQWPGSIQGKTKVTIAGQQLTTSAPNSDWSHSISLWNDGGKWKLGRQDGALRKRPGLQGPIDDAFMDSFVFVTTKRKSPDSAVQNWLDTESAHAMREWRRHFRGDIQVVDESEVTAAMMKESNIVMFADPRSGGLAQKLVSQLPVRWTESQIGVGSAEVPAGGHAAIFIYPNPANPQRYLVLNSGFTFREYDYLNNARQTPKLPDWALVDIRDGATTRLPGKVMHAGFFDEAWQPK